MHYTGPDFVEEAVREYGACTGWHMWFRNNQVNVSAAVAGFEDHFRSDAAILDPHESINAGLCEPDFQQMRSWFLQRDVLIQRIETPQARRGYGYYTVPLLPCEISTGFHATTEEAWHKIEHEGLLPGDSAAGRMSTGHRDDCQGLFFVCRELGTPADAEKRYGDDYGSSAHQWRYILSSKSGKSVDKFVVIRLDQLNELPGLRATNDILSKHGIILAGVDSIPPNRITLAWPPDLL